MKKLLICFLLTFLVIWFYTDSNTQNETTRGLNKNMSINLNPFNALSHAGNYVGGLFGNNTYSTSAPDATGGAPSVLNLLNPYSSGSGTPGSGSSQTSTRTPVSGTLQGTNETLTGGTGTTGTAAPTIDPQTQQAINNLQAALGTADTSLASGNQSLDNQYSSALQQLLLGKNQSQGQYNQGTQTNQLNYVGNKNTIGANAGSSLNGLLRLLGSRGISGSPVDAARQAVARDATLQRSDATQNFGTNQQGLDTNWGNYLTGYNNQVTGVGAQRDQGKQQLKQNVDSQKAQLLQTLASLQASPTAAQPYLDQANNLLNSVANITTPQINYETQAYTPAALSTYTANPVAANLTASSGANDYFSPYLSSLLGKKQNAVA